MLLPEVIERIRREREEQESRVLELTLPLPEFDCPEKGRDEDEATARSVIVIDLA